MHSYWVKVVMIIEGKYAHTERRWVTSATSGKDAMNQIDFQFSNLESIDFEKVE